VPIVPSLVAPSIGGCRVTLSPAVSTPRGIVLVICFVTATTTYRGEKSYVDRWSRVT
jgi:hypothetical protein